MKKTLNGKWLFSKAGEQKKKTATVPGCNYTDLMALGEIPDPFFKANELDVQWVAKSDWEYFKTIELTNSELSSDEIILHFDCLDTLCDVFVNSKLVGKSSNCFTSHEFDVKAQLKEGENEIRLYFHSPVNYVDKIYKKEGAPTNSNGQNGIVHLRKPQYHFGWDWGPVLPQSGICGNAELIFTNGARITELSVETKKNNDGSFGVFARVEAKTFCDCSCSLTLVSPDKKKIRLKGFDGEFKVEEPLLWQTFEQSNAEIQPLYTVVAELSCGRKKLDSASKRIGLREIKLNREKDEFGTKFLFELNGFPLFAKGANYIPPDSFMTRFDSKKLSRLLQSVRFSNMNIVRVWGGGFYASDEFLDMCDEMGILVWQDFQFACQAYPFFKEDFLQNVKDEIAFNVKRMKHHPCLALWCGNNEIEDMHMAWAHMKKYVDWTEKFFYHILEPEIRKFDKRTPFTPGSPTGSSHNKDVQSDRIGDTHLWGVWHGLRSMKYYRNRMTRFCSEFGFESFPDMKTIKSFGGSEESKLSDKIMSAHQKCNGGNDKILYYVASRFSLPEKLSDLVYLSQISQSLCISDAVYHWRRNSHRCYGALYWQLNDCWPVSSWSSLDYDLNYKALQYNAKDFNAPVTVCFEDSETQAKLFAINDLSKKVACKVEFEIFDFKNPCGLVTEREFVLEPKQVLEVLSTNLKKLSFRRDLKRTGLSAKLFVEGTLAARQTLLFDSEKKLFLQKATLNLDFEESEDEISITVSTDKFARFVCLQSSKSTLPTIDNFFDLLPGESKTVTMKKDPSMTAKEQIESISAMSLCDVKKQRTSVKSLFARYKVFLSATNIANAIYHGKKSSD